MLLIDWRLLILNTVDEWSNVVMIRLIELYEVNRFLYYPTDLNC